MNKKCIKSLIFNLIIGASLFTSCKDDDKMEYSAVAVTNLELKAALQQQGFTFDAEGKLLVDDKVKNTATLDLSGSNLTDASGLDVFPNLVEVNLANNKFGYVFDFAALPAKVNAVDLSGNEIYEYPGLVSVEIEENGDETVTLLRQLAKLYLPESARHNCDEIVRFHTANANADIKMVNADGALAPYNTLREVPDETLRTYLKTTYPSMFDANNPEVINIANRIVNPTEAGRALFIWQTNGPTFEGVQYIINHPSYKGTQIDIQDRGSNIFNLPYLKIAPRITFLALQGISTGYFNLSNAESIQSFLMFNNDRIETIDLSASKRLGTDKQSEYISTPAGSFRVNNCVNLKTVILPQSAVYLNQVTYTNLPALEELNLSQLKYPAALQLGSLTGLKKLSYFTPDFVPNGEQTRQITFTMSSEIYAFPETKAFLDAYHANMKSAMGFPIDLKPLITMYNWKQHYN